jgi:thiamine-monophosphate kinase
MTGLAISITCMGEVDKDKVAKRSTAKDTDLICVSGVWVPLIWACCFWKGKKRCSLETKSSADFSGKEYIIERQLKPEARKDIVEALARINVFLLYD